MVLNKAKPTRRKGQVFMAVSKSDGREPFCFEVREENLPLDSVMRNFKDWKGESGVCALLPISTIKQSGYSLVPADYPIIPVEIDQLPEDYETFLTSPTVELGSIGEFFESNRVRNSWRADLLEDNEADGKRYDGKVSNTLVWRSMTTASYSLVLSRSMKEISQRRPKKRFYERTTSYSTKETTYLPWGW
jgi:type I restriction-modification system DNA methylase subunit